MRMVLARRRRTVCVCVYVRARLSALVTAAGATNVVFTYAKSAECGEQCVAGTCPHHAMPQALT